MLEYWKVEFFIREFRCQRQIPIQSNSFTAIIPRYSTVPAFYYSIEMTWLEGRGFSAVIMYQLS